MNTGQRAMMLMMVTAVAAGPLRSEVILDSNHPAVSAVAEPGLDSGSVKFDFTNLPEEAKVSVNKGKAENQNELPATKMEAGFHRHSLDIESSTLGSHNILLDAPTGKRYTIDFNRVNEKAFAPVASAPQPPQITIRSLSNQAGKAFPMLSDDWLKPALKQALADPRIAMEECSARGGVSNARFNSDSFEGARGQLFLYHPANGQIFPINYNLTKDDGRRLANDDANLNQMEFGGMSPVGPYLVGSIILVKRQRSDRDLYDVAGFVIRAEGSFMTAVSTERILGGTRFPRFQIKGVPNCYDR